MRRMVFPLMLMAACQPATTELTDERRAEIAAEVNALNSEYWDAWRAADWDRGMSYYADSPDFVWAAGGAVYLGLGTLQETRPRFNHVASQTFTFRESRTVVMAPDAASVTALGTWAQTDTAGVTGPARDFAWTSVWIRSDGEWKIHLVHMSYPVRGPGSM
ncbi:MAG: nuclear transport factor 2 family protein [Gemmatimonadales bacterium]